MDLDSEYEFFVGTDSQIRKKEKKVTYATCVVLYKKGKGGRIFISKETKKIPNSLKERLAMEVWKSLETSMEFIKLKENLPITIHVDVNKSKKFKSGEYVQELSSLVTSQGFKCEVKPDSWCAQSIADRYSKKG